MYVLEKISIAFSYPVSQMLMILYLLQKHLKRTLFRVETSMQI
jgi:hypothetical protein